MSSRCKAASRPRYRTAEMDPFMPHPWLSIQAGWHRDAQSPLRQDEGFFYFQIPTRKEFFEC